ncbi:hypothetical protein NHX12_006140 [Muraenolepis orangiensis]|uniref:Uncharacterized protein n=1 Tax=Muraenolepis orangiensis TaxID=630683 RepID=A0A9Q0DU76_9TELE|nr:hypothetical protein NHX12_006140 [Muraenolepis orangiensis]
MLLLLEEKKDSTSRETGNIRHLYEVELADVRKSLDKLANERDRLKLDYGSLKEEHRKLQELQDVRHRHESRIMEVESGRRREFDSKLADSMQRLRQDHDVQVQQYKEELERNFCTKEESVAQVGYKQSTRIRRAFSFE